GTQFTKPFTTKDTKEQKGTQSQSVSPQRHREHRGEQSETLFNAHNSRNLSPQRTRRSTKEHSHKAFHHREHREHRGEQSETLSRHTIHKTFHHQGHEGTQRNTVTKRFTTETQRTQRRYRFNPAVR